MSDRPTAAVSCQEEALFDPLAPGFSTDPHPVFRRVREHDPVHRASRGFWLVTRYDDVLTVVRDHRFGRVRSAETIRRGWGESAAAKYISLRLSAYNPPDPHGCAQWSPSAFTGKRVELMRPHILLVAEQLLDKSAGLRHSTWSRPLLIRCPHWSSVRSSACPRRTVYYALE
jgi:cytochrome P450